MQNTNQSNSNTPPHNYFIFPGLRELLVGTGILTVIETFIGTSVLSALPPQSIFLAVMAFILLEAILILLIHISVKRSWSIWGFLLVSGTFLLGIYLIGLLFPQLAVVIPPERETPGWLISLIQQPKWAYHFYATWRTLLNIGTTYGWFTLLGSGLLLAHIYTKHDKAIEEKLNQL